MMNEEDGKMAGPARRSTKRKPQTIDLSPDESREMPEHGVDADAGAAISANADVSSEPASEHTQPVEADHAPFASPVEHVPPAETARAAFPAAMAGALAGFAVAAVMMLLPSLFGDNLAGRVTALEGRSTALPAPPADLKPVQDRLAVLEEGLPSAEKAAAAAQSKAQVAETDLAALRKRFEQISMAQGAGMDPAVLDSLENRLAASEAAVQTLRQDIESLKTTAGQANMASASPAVEKAARLAAADALQRRFSSGAPFMAELEVAGAFAPEAATLKTLRDVAATGTPTYARIEVDFLALTGTINAAIQPTAEDAGFLQRLAQSASSLVEVTPLDSAGTDPASLLGQVAAAIRNGQVTVAFATLDQMPEAAKKAAGPIREALQTRIGLETALAELTTSVIEPAKASQ
jgi:hypothetical protein